MGSIVDQEGVDITLVIVDDCSTDGSYEWVKEYLGHYPNVHILRNETNIGKFASLNVAMKYAVDNGIEFDYYTVTDPDDQQFPNRFSKIMEAANNYPTYTAIKQPYYRYNLDTQEMIEKSNVGEGSAVFRKEVFDMIGYWDNTIRFGGDTEYTLRLANWYEKRGLNSLDKVGRFTEPMMYAFSDNTGQNLTVLHPTDSPERQAVFNYINGFTKHGKPEECYYDYNNTGHPYPSVGAMEIGN